MSDVLSEWTRTVCESKVRVRGTSSNRASLCMLGCVYTGAENTQATMMELEVLGQANCVGYL